jgi:hypothetical protein
MQVPHQLGPAINVAADSPEPGRRVNRSGDHRSLVPTPREHDPAAASSVVADPDQQRRVTVRAGVQLNRTNLRRRVRRGVVDWDHEHRNSCKS